MARTDVAPPTVARLAAFAGAQHGDRRAVLVKHEGAWRERSYAEVSEEIERLAAGFVARGIQAGDRVCILADTRPEWSAAAFALWSAGAVVVPIYPSNAPEECAWIAGNSGAVAIVVEDAAQHAKIDAVREALPALRTIFVIEGGDADGVVTLDDVAASGADGRGVSRRRDAVAPDEPALIIYTSGTTGRPKGCLLSHRNAMSVCSMVLQLGTILPGEVTYLFLPLAHVFAQIAQLAAFQVGATIAYYGGDTQQIIPELSEVHPDYLPSVPRIFEKIYAAARSGIADQPPHKRAIFNWAVRTGARRRTLEHAGRRIPATLQWQYRLADRLVLSKVRALFGGNLREAITAGAPIAPEILEFFDAAGVPVMEGYGMTETMAAGTVNHHDAFRFGTVGRPAPGVEVRIAPDGEILMRGPHVFMGYWDNDEATREAFDESGWLRTGDLGSLDEDGFLRITGRKKDIIITAGGKNITPERLENDLKQSPFISQAVMYGDRRPYPVALVTLDPEAIIPWAREHRLPDDLGALSQRPEVHRVLQVACDSANAHYAQAEQIKRFTVLDHDLTQETGELTPTLKVKRNVVYERYADVLDELYAR